MNGQLVRVAAGLGAFGILGLAATVAARTPRPRRSRPFPPEEPPRAADGQAPPAIPTTTQDKDLT